MDYYSSEKTEEQKQQVLIRDCYPSQSILKMLYFKWNNVLKAYQMNQGNVTTYYVQALNTKDFQVAIAINDELIPIKPIYSMGQLIDFHRGMGGHSLFI